MAKLYRHTAKVFFRSEFPLDMLRYDGCSPATEEDSYRIRESITHDGRPQKELNPVTVVRIDDQRQARWTEGRWNSFGAHTREQTTEPLN